jgi:UDPglucose 6-dehydrogenase
MPVRRIAVVGTGYVGLTTGACLASLGHEVWCADVDAAKVAHLRAGRVAILEPGLAELVTASTNAGRLHFVVGARSAVAMADTVFLCVPTPMGRDGAADLTVVESVIREVREMLPTNTVVVNKSTVPVGTAARVRQLLGRKDVTVVSNPEFLREGTAVADFLNPDRIVIGSDTAEAGERVADIYTALVAPVMLTDTASAELIKYAANCYLAMRLSYINAMGELCEQLGGNVLDVATGMGLDHRIGSAFLMPGPGWGGSCLPKDTAALTQIAVNAGVEFPLLQATIDINKRQRERILQKIHDAAGGDVHGQRIALLGLAFKAGTNDLRDAPALTLAAALVAEGAEVVAYDPAVVSEVPDVQVVDDAYLAVKGASATLLLTDWPELRALDWRLVAELMHGSVVLDTRHHLDARALERAGLTYLELNRTARPDHRSAA